MPTRKGVLNIGRDALIIILITFALGELGLRIYNYVNPLPIFYLIPTIDGVASRLRRMDLSISIPKALTTSSSAQRKS